MNRGTRATLLLASLAMVMFLTAGAPAVCQAGKGFDSFEKWWLSPVLTQELNLTPEERRKMDDIFLAYREKVIDIRAEKEKAKLTLENLFDRTILDEEAIDQAIERIKAAKAESTGARYLFLLEVRKFLGMERYAKLRELFEARKN